MTQPGLTLTIEGVAEVERMLEAPAERAADPRFIFRAIVPDFQREMRREFTSEGRTGGKPWWPLAPATLERKSAEGLPLLILEASGKLKASLVGTGRTGRLVSVTKRSVTLGTRLSYAHILRAGSRKIWLPPRQVLVSPGTERRWLEAVEAGILEGRRP